MPRLVFIIGLCLTASLACAATDTDIRPFLQKNCAECHDADAKKGGLDLGALRLDLRDPASFAEWVKVNDRVVSGEMPPAKKKERPEPAELKAFNDALSSTLLTADQARVAGEGRATRRRLNRFEYEQALSDLLDVPYLEVKSFLPEDTQSHGFNKIGDALDVSHVQLARYLTASEFAIHEAMAPQTARPKTTTTRYDSWDQREFTGKLKLLPNNRKTIPLVGLELRTDLIQQNSPRPVRSDDPAIRAQEAMGIVVSSYEPTEIRFGSFRAPISGKYRLRFLAYTFWVSPDFKKATEGRRPEPVTIYAETPPRSLRKLASFDVGPGPTLHEIEAYMLAGETIRPDAARFFRSRPPDHKNPLQEADGAPGVAFNWMEVDGPLVEQWPPASHQLLFGDLPTKDRPAIAEVARPGRNGGPGFRRPAPPPGVEVISQDPGDAERLLRRFMQHVYRRPVQDVDVARFLGVVHDAMQSGYNFTDAMVAAYTGVLSSPAFLYLDEKPGPLDDVALANRLSLFLWNSVPDEELNQLAHAGKLHQSEILREQTERMLNDPRSRRLINAFLDYWLDVRFVQGASPDAELYPDYQLDDQLVESMIGETQLFFAELVKRNMPARNLVASDFAVLNERLATHYGITGVSGAELRLVPLPRDSVRGGLLTQGSVLKVTSNGTSTSPVKRGAWIMTRLLGKPPPPPPAGVPAVEPDIRGATTIREQLARHRSEATCAACHRNIDPSGFALESFDVMGAWRDRYRTIGGDGERVKGIGHNGLYYHFSLGPEVDSSGELPDGRQFADVRELKKYLLDDQEQLARNLTHQLAIYATGAPIQFSDRPQIAKILADTRSQGYGIRELVQEIVQSELFRNK
ncbi:MAG TPA: DUF1592 domain-containing protein [Humisphaera sp.]|nr:DUF1592 domain-containing protein [Humisphaera sp.]